MWIFLFKAVYLTIIFLFCLIFSFFKVHSGEDAGHALGLSHSARYWLRSLHNLHLRLCCAQKIRHYMTMYSSHAVVISFPGCPFQCCLLALRYTPSTSGGKQNCGVLGICSKASGKPTLSPALLHSPLSSSANCLKSAAASSSSTNSARTWLPFAPA